MKQTVLSSWNLEWPHIRSHHPQALGKGVLDQATFDTVEIDELFDTVNYAQTMVGQSVLYRSLTNPLADAEQISAKQEAVSEIRDNPGVRENIEGIINSCAETEQNLYVLLYGEFLGSLGTAREKHQIEGYGYKQYRRGMNFVLSLVGHIYSSEKPQSHYLQEIFNKINNFSQTRTYALMAGPVYNSEKGFQTKAERKGSFTPAAIFKPSIFKPLLIASIFAVLWAITAFFPTEMFSFSKDAIPVASIFFIPMLLIYFPVIGSYDRDNCIIPLRNEYRQSDDLGEALDALGQLDELLAFIKYAESYGSPTCLPTMLEADKHSIDLKDAKNPVLGHNNPDYVGNDFRLAKENLVFITGPNSGGKTAFCKTITQIQTLAQIGCYVPAQKATLAVADGIFYQAPEISHLDDGEGRYGTELKRTRDIFINSSAKSLVVLDEMSEGTTFEEKMESSTNVLEGFFRKNNNTILITHNHQLVDVFVKKRIGMPKQVEFADDEPTYKLIKGISRVSHADRVAKKIGFSKQDIDNYLAGSS
jgi:DNA mismatch repair protein MutS